MLFVSEELPPPRLEAEYNIEGNRKGHTEGEEKEEVMKEGDEDHMAHQNNDNRDETMGISLGAVAQGHLAGV